MSELQTTILNYLCMSFLVLGSVSIIIIIPIITYLFIKDVFTCLFND